jgi:hypothetical protein
VQVRTGVCGALLVYAFAALCGACLVVPKTRTTTKKVGDRVERAPVKAGERFYSTRVQGSELQIEATHTQCIHRTIGMFEVTKGKSAGVADLGGGEAGFLAAIFLPLTIASALATASEVSSHKSEVSEREELIGTKKGHCRLPAVGMRVSLYLPSGTRLWALTDERGRVSFSVPQTEPARGQVVLRVGDDSWTEAYRRPDVLVSLEK